MDQTGVTIAGAIVKLTRDDSSAIHQTVTDEDGKFYFFNVPPGPFHLAFSSPGLESREISGSLDPSESYVTPLVELAIATQDTEVRVTMTQ